MTGKSIKSLFCVILICFFTSWLCWYFVLEISQNPLTMLIHHLAPNNNFDWLLPKHFTNWFPPEIYECYGFYTDILKSWTIFLLYYKERQEPPPLEEHHKDPALPEGLQGKHPSGCFPWKWRPLDSSNEEVCPSIFRLLRALIHC